MACVELRVLPTPLAPAFEPFVRVPATFELVRLLVTFFGPTRLLVALDVFDRALTPFELLLLLVKLVELFLLPDGRLYELREELRGALTWLPGMLRGALPWFDPPRDELAFPPPRAKRILFGCCARFVGISSGSCAFWLVSARSILSPFIIMPTAKPITRLRSAFELNFINPSPKIAVLSTNFYKLHLI
jgi:hypothetical protein